MFNCQWNISICNIIQFITQCLFTHFKRLHLIRQHLYWNMKLIPYLINVKTNHKQKWIAYIRSVHSQYPYVYHSCHRRYQISETINFTSNFNSEITSWVKIKNVSEMIDQQ